MEFLSEVVLEEVIVRLFAEIEPRLLRNWSLVLFPRESMSTTEVIPIIIPKELNPDLNLLDIMVFRASKI